MANSSKTPAPEKDIVPSNGHSPTLWSRFLGRLQDVPIPMFFAAAFIGFFFLNGAFQAFTGRSMLSVENTFGMLSGLFWVFLCLALALMVWNARGTRKPETAPQALEPPEKMEKMNRPPW